MGQQPNKNPTDILSLYKYVNINLDLTVTYKVFNVVEAIEKHQTFITAVGLYMKAVT